MKLRFPILFLLAALSGAAARAAESPATLIPRGDSVFAGRTLSTGAAEAIQYYDEAIKANPKDGEALWRRARAEHWLGDHAEAKADKTKYLEKAIDDGKAAIELLPQSPDAHFWLGAAYGSYGEVKGIMKSLHMVGPIRQEMQAINKINERFQGGAGYRVLGIVDYKVPGFVGGSKSRARIELGQALNIDPANAFNLYYMAEFLSQTGDRMQALAFLNRLASSTTTPDVDGPDLESIQAKGQKLREKLRG